MPNENDRNETLRRGEQPTGQGVTSAYNRTENTTGLGQRVEGLESNVTAPRRETNAATPYPSEASFGERGTSREADIEGSSERATADASPSSVSTEQPRRKQRRGFAAMDPAKQKEIASKGGKASHEQGTGHEWDSEAAREAGRKGGQASRGGRGKIRTPEGGTGGSGL